jgi:DNA-binding LytR/AlgR family response regulator
MPVKVLIVDDEYPSRQELRCILEEITNIEIIGECCGGNEAYQKVLECDVDAVFLDIQMTTMNDGLVAAEKIKKTVRAPKIIFTTGYSEFAIQAFEMEALDYVLKPYSRERIELTIERLTREDIVTAQGNLLSQTERTPEQVRIPIWNNNRLIVFQPAEIFFVQTEQKRKTILYTVKGDFVTTMPLKELQERLAACGFFRTHKSFLVNLRKVREITPWFNDTYMLTIEGCSVTDIPVAKHFIREFKHAMGINP